MQYQLQMTNPINDNLIDSEIHILACLMESYTKQYEMNAYVMEESSSNKEGILTKIWNAIKSIFQLIGKCLKSIFQKFSKPNQHAKKINHIVEHTDPEKNEKDAGIYARSRFCKSSRSGLPTKTSQKSRTGE